MNPPLEQWIRKYFPEESLPGVQKLLSAYGAESWHKEPDRVKRDLVILSRGSISKLRAGIELACVDYRDVLVGEEVDPWMISELKNPPATPS